MMDHDSKPISFLSQLKRECRCTMLHHVRCCCSCCCSRMSCRRFQSQNLTGRIPAELLSSGSNVISWRFQHNAFMCGPLPGERCCCPVWASARQSLLFLQSEIDVRFCSCNSPPGNCHLDSWHTRSCVTAVAALGLLINLD